MPTSTTYLPDVNVWLALASSRHFHAPVCAAWLNGLESAGVAFCRVTQMGLLRLLTTASIMGTDVLTSRAAWRAYRTLLSDPRLRFAPEPPGLDAEWQQLMSQNHPAPKLWTDAYLAAFARTSGMRLVTLDRAMLSLSRETMLLQ